MPAITSTAAQPKKAKVSSVHRALIQQDNDKEDGMAGHSKVKRDYFIPSTSSPPRTVNTSSKRYTIYI